jgi:hypothetical protein
MKSTELERAAKYSKDLDGSEFCLEVESFKHQAQTLQSCVETAARLELFQLIQDFRLSSCYPNIKSAVHFF